MMSLTFTLPDLTLKDKFFTTKDLQNRISENPYVIHGLCDTLLTVIRL